MLTEKQWRHAWDLLVRVRAEPFVAAFYPIRTLLLMEVAPQGLFQRGLVRQRRVWLRSRWFGRLRGRHLIYTITPRGRLALRAGFAAFRAHDLVWLCDDCAARRDLGPAAERDRGRCESCYRGPLPCGTRSVVANPALRHFR